MKLISYSLAASLIFLLGWISVDSGLKDNLILYENVLKTIETNYIKPVDVDEMVLDAIRESATSLDPYSKFFDAEETKLREEHGWNGILYGGIGVNILKRDDYVSVTHVRGGYGAANAGLMVGDEIIEVDGRDVIGMNANEVSEIVVGPEGTPVLLKMRRAEKFFTVEISRALIKSLAVPYSEKLGTCGYIKFDHFLRGSSQDLKAALWRLQEQNIEQLVLDLRGNYGGLINEAVSAASLFLPKGSMVMSQIGRIQAANYSSQTESEPICPNLPIVLLVDSLTISSAEIFAGAMQDLDRMLIVGETTAGKGIVQTTYYPGQGTSLYITVSGYYVPSGRSIQNLDYNQAHLGKNPLKVDTTSRVKYFTQNGREVFARGGIEPDIAIKWKNYSPYVSFATASNLAFEFLNDYANKATQDDTTLDFELKDQEFDPVFENIVESTDSLKMRVDAQLTELEDSWSGLGFAGDDSFSVLRETVRTEKRNQLLKSKESIRSEFEKEVLRRLYFENGVYYRNVKSDFENYQLKEYFTQYNQVLNNSKR